MRNDGNCWNTLPGKRDIIKIVWFFLATSAPNKEEIAQIDKSKPAIVSVVEEKEKDKCVIS
jgi:hypothetical protein